jgi:hypothetical protein
VVLEEFEALEVVAVAHPDRPAAEHGRPAT